MDLADSPQTAQAAAFMEKQLMKIAGNLNFDSELIEIQKILKKQKITDEDENDDNNNCDDADSADRSPKSGDDSDEEENSNSDDGGNGDDDEDEEEDDEESAEMASSKLFSYIRQLESSEGRDADEWENDDDNGYMVVSLTEEEFYNLEEEASKALQSPAGRKAQRAREAAEENAYAADFMGRLDRSGSDVSEYVGVDAKSSVFEGDDDEAEEDAAAEFSNKSAAEDGDVTSPLSNSNNNSSTGEQSPAVASIDIANINQKATEMAKELAAGAFTANASEARKQAASRHRRKAELAAATKNRRQSTSDRRRTEIMGQEKFVGADGIVHSYFNLKVVFEPNRTGFESTKDMVVSKGTIVAGRCVRACVE